jgi:glycine cleavage system H protein
MSYSSKIPDGLKYTKEHEWAKFDGNIATVGITDYAQHSLTDIVFVELPKPGNKVQQFKALCVVESVKSVSDIFSPVSGEVIEPNHELGSSPGDINTDPYGKGWIAKVHIESREDASRLMDAAGYKKYLEGLSH